MKTLEGSTVELLYTDGVKSHKVTGVLDSLFVMLENANNNIFLVIKTGNTELFVALFYVVSMRIVKSKTYQKPEAEPDRMVT